MLKSAFGVFNLHKPPGLTSRQVVDRVTRVLRPSKAGHAGTLDPLASGVLVVCVGGATRLIEYVQAMPKVYVGTFLLGRHSPSEDVESEVTELENPPVPTTEEIVTATGKFLGQIQQRPPAFSALKVDGRRAYKLARQGELIEFEPRPVTIHRIELKAYCYPELTLEIECGSGTYIRSLGRDLAEELGTAAVMSGLVRTSIGSFHLCDAIYPSQLDRDHVADHLLPATRAVEVLPRIELTSEELVELSHGRTIQRDTSQTPGAPNEYAAVDPSGRLAAILEPRGEGLLGPRRNFVAAQ